MFFGKVTEERPLHRHQWFRHSPVHGLREGRGEGGVLGAAVPDKRNGGTVFLQRRYRLPGVSVSNGCTTQRHAKTYRAERA